MMSDAMQTLRQIIEVGGDRKLELTLPDNVEPGPMGVVVTFQPVSTVEPIVSPLLKFRRLFGFLPKRVDPMEFQRQMRNELDR